MIEMGVRTAARGVDETTRTQVSRPEREGYYAVGGARLGPVERSGGGR